jgi:hypothetical protein
MSQRVSQIFEHLSTNQGNDKAIALLQGQVVLITGGAQGLSLIIKYAMR